MADAGVEAPRGAHVELGDFPLDLFAAAAAQWSGLLREYVLRSFGGLAQAYGPEDVQRAGMALDALTAGVAPFDVEGLPRPTPQRADVRVNSSTVAVSDFAMLQGVLDDATRLSRAGELLMLPPLPEIVALRNWVCDEVVGQAAGAAQSPWRLRGDGPQPQQTEIAWDPHIEPGPGTCWLIGDDHNIIVAASQPALSLLGWSTELVGQRLLAVIPPAYREAHLAAFTRSVVEGGGRVLGRPLKLSALRADGSEIPVTLTLTRHPARAGRTVYVGRIEACSD